MRTGQKIRCIEVDQLADARDIAKQAGVDYPMPEHDTLYTADEFTLCDCCGCFSVSLVELDNKEYPFHWFEIVKLS